MADPAENTPLQFVDFRVAVVVIINTVVNSPDVVYCNKITPVSLCCVPLSLFDVPTFYVL